MIAWADMTGTEKGEAIERLVPALSYREVADKLGAPSREAVAGALWRHRHPEESAEHLAEFAARRRPSGAHWTERRLTETWAERKARRAKEKHLSSTT